MRFRRAGPRPTGRGHIWEEELLIGAVADDITGATDLCLMLSREGMRTIQVIGVPTDDVAFSDADAVVVALKSRTIPAAEAVEMSCTSARALLAAGAEQLIFKYCSTFDSTDAGNIGPVAEALQDLTGAPVTIACPSFPAAGRTVYKGHLFVGDRLLSESPLKDHPLTPMRDPDLVRVLQRQCSRPVGLVQAETIAKGPDAVKAAFAEQYAAGKRILIVDTLSDADLRTIGKACAGMKLVTGGSGVAMGLPENFRQTRGFVPPPREARMAAPAGRAAILAGSCSAATRGQIEAAKAAGLPALRLDIAAVAEGRQTAADLAQWAINTPADRPPLIYSSAGPDELAEIQTRMGRHESGALVERTLADVARRLAGAGFSRFLVAGGETSGAIVEALGVKVLLIGPEIDPGVPWTRSISGPDLALALKSGNFGATDFFLKAWELLEAETEDA
ncbi:3-oxo-tetronate kinase [Ciceribacter sp. RN22]|uniref:3-oxo-tetronate kinase n=1 Tax=Ciceribacter sp. RN22 TaxID=2954932 RepID=UPI0020931A78|nr:3-oxo-tetronate kinase [Ciceribacter sp. RN22]MCO6179804.1 four-carbon acid sugar kinase family protein [Ciceribacter sp. RN22]